MAFCDAAVYVDGTEFSVDEFCLEEAMYESMHQRNCFLWFDAQATSAGLRMHRYGVQSWQVQLAMDTGVFASHPDTNQYESLPEDMAGPPSAAASSTSTPSPANTQQEKEANAGAEKKAPGVAEQIQSVDFTDIHGEGTQLSLFDKK